MANATPTRREYALLGLIVLAAALVRILGLTRESFWSDETFSAYATLFSNPGEVVDYARSDVHPPGYYLALWGWTRIFGNGEFAIRLLSAVGGVLLVPIVFRLGRQLFSARTGLIAASLAAFLIQPIYFSQEARAYSWVATLSTMAVTLAIDARNGRGMVDYLLLSVTTAVLGYFHYFGLLFALLLWVGLIVLPNKTGSRTQALGGAALFALAFVPWLPHVATQRSHVNWIPAPDVRYVTELFNVYYGPGLPVDVWIAAFLAAGIPIAMSRAEFRLKSAESALAVWIILPLIVTLALSAILRPVYSPRNMLIGSGAAVLLLARALEELGLRFRNIWLPTLGVLIGMYGIHFATGKGYFVRPTKQQIREASQFVLDRNRELPVYTVAWDRINFEYYYHLASRRNELRTVQLADLESGGLAASVPDREFWLASAGIDINLHENLRNDFEVLESGEFLQARAYHLRRKQP